MRINIWKCFDFSSVCQTDQAKGIFRRRPSTGSTRSSRSNSLKPPSNGAQSCPTSPNHMHRKSIRTDSISNSTTIQIPEDDELDISYNSSGPSSLPEQSIRNRERKHEERKEFKPKQPQQQQYDQREREKRKTLEPQSEEKQRDKQRQQERPQNQMNQREAQKQQQDQREQQERKNQQELQQSLHRSASTISNSAFRPRSGPSGLHSYTGRTSANSTPSSVHGSRVDITKDERGSAMYLGCNAPRINDSSWSINSSRSTDTSSQPATPNHTPPVSPRKASTKRRPTSVVKK